MLSICYAQRVGFNKLLTRILRRLPATWVLAGVLVGAIAKASPDPSQSKNLANSQSGVPAAEATQGLETKYILCRNKKTVRTIRVEPGKQDGTWQTKYTKEGVDHVVGAARSKESCVSILENIRGNLEKAAWTCKDISASLISSDLKPESEDHKPASAVIQ